LIPLRFVILLAALASLQPLLAAGLAPGPSTRVVDQKYHKEIEPILQQYCSDCHADGAKKGNMALDEFKDDTDLVAHKGQWLAVLKNLRAGVMPPPGKPRPNEVQQKQLADWIKQSAFGIDRKNPDPGRVTIHRLNRVEYRNTIAQLLGVDYNTDDEFPPDGAGLGLDNIADLLTMSPLVLEKYLKAAEVVLDGAMPSEKGREFSVPGSAFRGNNNSTGERLSFNGAPEVVFAYRNKNPGAFRVVFELEVTAPPAATNNPATNVTFLNISATNSPGINAAGTNNTVVNVATNCHLVIHVQSGIAPSEVLMERDFGAGPKKYEFAFDQSWGVEPHMFLLNVSNPAAPAGGRGGFRSGGGKGGGPPPGPQLRITNLRITARPTAEALRFFAQEAPAAAAPELRNYIRRGVADFGLHAFRRPMDDPTLDRLSNEVAQRYREGGIFVDSVKPTLAKILCSPRFLFRATQTAPARKGEPWALIDEYSLASRLSYFLWSSMPDDELLNLAAKGELRKNLGVQVKRMLNHKFASRLVENFSGQWLQTRNVMKWTVVEAAVLKREGKTAPRTLLTDEIRQAMRDETTLYFARILKEDRSVLEFIDSDYTYLNEGLAGYYGVPGVAGSELRLVKLPDGSPRGGVLTHGSTLLVTSGANRTSAVKRGVFVLDTFLGLRPHDPPPDIPGIEQASAKITDHEATFREALELHRQDPLCASCHKLMDPIGFGLDNFNALGMYREQEYGQKIDASGKLASGEKFNGIGELKQILKTHRRQDFYRCLTEKLMTYALGRGVEYYDTESVDQIVARLEKEEGRFSALLMGIIESAPFEKRRIGSAQNDEAVNKKVQTPSAGLEPSKKRTL
jgi:mono/diheme cytochrome c family protein